MEMGPIYWHLQEFDVFRIDEQELHLLAKADMSLASFDCLCQSHCGCGICWRCPAQRLCMQRVLGCISLNLVVCTLSTYTPSVAISTQGRSPQLVLNR